MTQEGLTYPDCDTNQRFTQTFTKIKVTQDCSLSNRFFTLSNCLLIEPLIVELKMTHMP